MHVLISIHSPTLLVGIQLWTGVRVSASKYLSTFVNQTNRDSKIEKNIQLRMLRKTRLESGN